MVPICLEHPHPSAWSAPLPGAPPPFSLECPPCLKHPHPSVRSAPPPWSTLTLQPGEPTPAWSTRSCPECRHAGCIPWLAVRTQLPPIPPLRPCSPEAIQQDSGPSPPCMPDASRDRSPQLPPPASCTPPCLPEAGVGGIGDDIGAAALVPLHVQVTVPAAVQCG